MQCFVIMPFDRLFNDVYRTIQYSVTSLKYDPPLKCERLDDVRPAGRITDRLISALRDSSFCIADLTGCNPNVMWETGYAMALGKSVIVTTQDLSTLPFDMRDMQAITYDRDDLFHTLGTPLQGVILATLGKTPSTNQQVRLEDQSRLVISLGVQIAELKDMIGQIVSTFDQRSRAIDSPRHLSERLRHLTGSWFNVENRSSIYIRIINDSVVAPYCFSGNTELTGHYYDWQEMGEYLFARFRWFSEPISGFSFLKTSANDTLQGAWWHDFEVDQLPKCPPVGSGNQVIWRRTNLPEPQWAKEFFEKAEQTSE